MPLLERAHKAVEVTEELLDGVEGLVRAMEFLAANKSIWDEHADQFY